MATSEPSAAQPPSYEVSQQQVVYPPPQQPSEPASNTTTTIITQPTQIVTTVFFGPTPVALTCPHCQAQVVTTTRYEPGALTWLLCGGIAIFGCFYGCCFIPFCIDGVKDCRHTCPNCNNFLGVYRRI